MSCNANWSIDGDILNPWNQYWKFQAYAYNGTTLMGDTGVKSAGPTRYFGFQQVQFHFFCPGQIIAKGKSGILSAADGQYHWYWAFESPNNVG